MTKHLNLLVLLAALALLGAGCQQQPKQSDKVKITLTSAEGFPTGLSLTTQNMLSLEPAVLAQRESDTSKTAVLEFRLLKPTFAYLQNGDSWHTLYLSPGDELALSPQDLTPDKPAAFSGKGAAANNYLARLSLLRKQFETVNGAFVFELAPKAFLSRADSLENKLSLFHRSYTDSVALPAETAALLEQYSQIMLLSIKQNYYMAHREDPELPEAFKQLTDNVPFDASLLEAGFWEYPFLLRMYTEAALEAPYFENKSPEEMASIATEVPLLVDQDIKKGKYPEAIQEYLRAGNLYHTMVVDGLTPTTTKLISNFKQEYSTSAYLPGLEQVRQKWLPLSAGQPAPAISGTSPEGTPLSLSQFKGKVVYADIWATWCKPCREEIPHANALKKAFEGNKEVVFLNVSIDRDREAWKKMLLDNPEFKGIHLNTSEAEADSLNSAYLISGVPRYLLIDQEGKIVNANAPRPSSGRVREEIKALLAKVNMDKK